MRINLLISLLALCLCTDVWGQDSTKNISIAAIVPGVYVHTSYGKYKGEWFPANGVYVVTRKGVVIIDTPWDEQSAQQLIDSIRERHHQPVVLCVATHYHADRTAGLDLYKKLGIATYSSKLTDSMAEQRKEKRAEYLFQKDTLFQVGGTKLYAFYPGRGHSIDNIVVWLPQEKVLFGGCLVKSVEAEGLGNVADADIDAWPSTIRLIKDKFRGVRYVIPGHQTWSAGSRALDHTLLLLQKRKNG